MKILFAHQNFPGQYRNMLDWLIRQGGHEIVFVTQRRDVKPIPGMRLITYKPHHVPSDKAYTLSKNWEECCGAGFAVAQVCRTLTAEGFRPDIIMGHIGWGELTFVKEVWPDVPVLGYFEYYYLGQGGPAGFDPEFPASENTGVVMHARNAVNYINLETVDLGVTPTRWQHDTFPESFHRKLYLCHDGIRTDRLIPHPRAAVKLGRLDRPLTREDEVFTYVSRNMEPTRGFHIFMRALPRILKERPNARVIIVGGNGTSYGRKSDEAGGYRAEMEAEIGDRVDWDRVHFLGRVPFAEFTRIIQISRCHVYLTAPFVLSWSLLESMSMGATIVASDTAPVREVLEHGKTAMLVDFFDHGALADQVVDVLSRPDDFAHLGKAARAQAVSNYDFFTACLPTHLERINGLVKTADPITPPTP